ncbi:MAG: hypothetical protein M1828_005742 [Chrysothrix sp. TS-e1954]|nr:MAG: hypothetical protein M1828_005742 [Chrysothrix sp. TS-e1954]
MSELRAPRKSVELEDVGAHDQSEDEHFSDASEGQINRPAPIPTTRVERTDDEPSHGEVPGTPAHAMRKGDATPDEFEVIPEKSGEDIAQSDDIPRTVVQKVEPSTPSHGEIPGTQAHDMRQADAEPDEVTSVPAIASDKAEASDIQEIEPQTSVVAANTQQAVEVVEGETSSYEEQASDGDDFGAFDDGEEFENESPPPRQVSEQRTDSTILSPNPVLDVSKLRSVKDFSEAARPFLDAIFPDTQHDAAPDLFASSDIELSFLTERSASLWMQLVAPPPLQPPDWIRSRIRRLFLVSLGVPVDLDEILPASKQNKLVLPSISLEMSEREPGRQDDNWIEKTQNTKDLTEPVAAANARPDIGRKKRGPNLPPELDLNTARLLCSTTEEALMNQTTAELLKHTELLEQMKQLASEMLAYWLVQRDSASGEKEALEEVIENLVKHAQKHRR